MILRSTSLLMPSHCAEPPKCTSGKKAKSPKQKTNSAAARKQSPPIPTKKTGQKPPSTPSLSKNARATQTPQPCPSPNASNAQASLPSAHTDSHPASSSKWMTSNPCPSPRPCTKNYPPPSSPKAPSTTAFCTSAKTHNRPRSAT